MISTFLECSVIILALHLDLDNPEMAADTDHSQHHSDAKGKKDKVPRKPKILGKFWKRAKRADNRYQL